MRRSKLDLGRRSVSCWCFRKESENSSGAVDRADVDFNVILVPALHWNLLEWMTMRLFIASQHRLKAIESVVVAG
ncbi:MAG: hypothetical protein ONB13_11900 [candidate division KSB1 bacterium]|nr:hypothetical protein [candidate division KSB1 bacterium]MDZ7357906.1 hypothetical protein [candidate division KSB1 bacterium]MDZ7377308.1 hypothetical protein [candidate division KSB1 bacterium]MDZ7401626.1 hypothetical protein [candidate division KSB1 bacterium]